MTEVTTTLTRAEIKNPRPVAFVKQANISGGHQQVNNGMQPAQQAGSAAADVVADAAVG